MKLDQLKDICATRHNIALLECSIGDRKDPLIRARLEGIAEAYGKVLDLLQEIEVA